LSALTKRYPGDAELYMLVAFITERFDLAAALAAAERASEIDDRYGDAFELRARELAAMGRLDEARAVIDRCVALSPAMVDCRRRRAEIAGADGRCAAMDDDLRQVIAVASNPLPAVFELRADALAALGRPRDVLAEVLHQKQQYVPVALRDTERLYDEARLDLLAGDFARADRELADALDRLNAKDTAEAHAAFAGLRVATSLEVGDEREAAAMASDYQQRAEAWMRASSPTPLYGTDSTVLMLRVRERAGELSAAAYALQRDAWVRRMASTASRSSIWEAAFAIPAMSHEDALAALQAVPESVWREASPAALGKVLLLADRLGDALRPLKMATAMCFPFNAPIESTRAFLDYGHALEAMGDDAGACEAYQRVLSRWGSARPSSQTASDARTRAAQVCPKR
jgi:tetratricopeptide (TPR) repeat protein